MKSYKAAINDSTQMLEKRVKYNLRSNIDKLGEPQKYGTVFIASVTDRRTNHEKPYNFP